MKKRSFWRNLLIGYSSLLNIFPLAQKKTILPNYQSDEDALKSDWEMVGNDLRFAFKKFHDDYENGNSRAQ